MLHGQEPMANNSPVLDVRELHDKRDMYRALEDGASVYLCSVTTVESFSAPHANVESGKVVLAVKDIFLGIKRESIVLPYYAMWAGSAGSDTVWGVPPRIGPGHWLCIIIPDGTEHNLPQIQGVHEAACYVNWIDEGKNSIVDGMVSLSLDKLKTLLALYAGKPTPELLKLLPDALADADPFDELSLKVVLLKLSQTAPDDTLNVIRGYVAQHKDKLQFFHFAQIASSKDAMDYVDQENPGRKTSEEALQFLCRVLVVLAQAQSSNMTPIFLSALSGDGQMLVDRFKVQAADCLSPAEKDVLNKVLDRETASAGKDMVAVLNNLRELFLSAGPAVK